jgi:hypothetical protein
MNDYSTHKISSKLMDELTQAVQSVQSYGSVEVIIQNKEVTQITVRNIKKTNPKNEKQYGEMHKNTFHTFN